MDFLIKYVAYTAAKRETIIPHCPNADVALQAFKKLVDLNNIRLKKVTEISVIRNTKNKKGPKHENESSSHAKANENRQRN